MNTFKHWIAPGVYEANPSIEEPVMPTAEHKFHPGDRVKCVKTFVPFRAEAAGQSTHEGEFFTVRAYLVGYEYLILEEIGEYGYQNAARFEKVEKVEPSASDNFRRVLVEGARKLKAGMLEGPYGDLTTLTPEEACVLYRMIEEKFPGLAREVG